MGFGCTRLVVNPRARRKIVETNEKKKNSKIIEKLGKSKKKHGEALGNDDIALKECLGVKVVLKERVKPDFGIYNFSCSARCRHPPHFHSRGESALVLSHRIKSDDWISEQIYKRYTDTDSRPLSPNFGANLIKPNNLGLPKIGASLLSTAKDKGSQLQRKCLTPEPETKPCQFHPRRVLILDLRRVKSVDAIVKQESITTNDTDSLYGDDDEDKTGSSTPFPQYSSPRHLSVSRSVTPKIKVKSGQTYRKFKNRSVSPITYERSTSPKILEGLTLPPLHSSVLTLLGQRAPYSGIPSQNGIIPSKQKKLRRHGRRRTSKASENREQQSEGRESAGENRDSATREIPQLDAENAAVSEDASSKTVVPLFEILNETITKKNFWYRTRENLDTEIDTLRQALTQNASKLRANGIKIKEDTWLSYPRTWSISSATFSCPLSSSELKEMTPLEYLTKYVEISQPRQDLYSLVFKRYLTLENPLGKTISIETAQKALTEVLGRSLSSNDKSELFRKELGIISEDLELSELEFKGICAFCERIYGEYSLDESKECYVCWKYPKTDKNRCHRKTQNLIELTDIELIKKKIQNDQVNPVLANFFHALTKR